VSQAVRDKIAPRLLVKRSPRVEIPAKSGESKLYEVLGLR
jgi:hypothetical protein